MKRGIFVNIWIVTQLGFMLILLQLFGFEKEAISLSVFLFIMVYSMRKKFILRDARIEKILRMQLLIMIILNYLVIVISYIALIKEMIVLLKWMNVGEIVIYIVLIFSYFINLFHDEGAENEISRIE